LVLFFLSSNVRGDPSYLLRVQGLDGENVVVSDAQWRALPKTAVRAPEHDGVEAQFDGVRLSALLALVQAPSGKALRGANTDIFVLALGSDDYGAVFALAELDKAFTDRDIIVATHKDGAPLAKEEGPLRVVVPAEGRQARWVRDLTWLCLSHAKYENRCVVQGK
jgi:hypothetical protein